MSISNVQCGSWEDVELEKCGEQAGWAQSQHGP